MEEDKETKVGRGEGIIMAIVKSGLTRIRLIDTRRRGQYVTKITLSKKLDTALVELTNDQFSFLRAMVFPIDGHWPNAASLPNALNTALQWIDLNGKMITYFKSNTDDILEKLKKWNSFTNLPRAELTRKIEGTGASAVSIRKIYLYGRKFVDFVQLHYNYPNTSILKLLKAAAKGMRERGWDGDITPKICLCNVKGVDPKESDSSGKLNVESIGEE